MQKGLMLSRRRFLKLCGIASLLVALRCSLLKPVNAKSSSLAYGFLIDVTRCTGCMMCVGACKKWNHLKWKEYPRYPTDLSAHTWTVVKEVTHRSRVYYVKRQCMHCVDPICVAVCPVNARTKHPEGNVIVNTRVCVGCRYCMQVCPFNIPYYDDERGVVMNCWLCYNRVKGGMPPACVDACPYGALDFGLREEILHKARRRAEEIGGYVYGEEEAGGTTVIYISDVPLWELGFPSNELTTKSPLPPLELLQAMSGFPTGAAIAILVGLIIRYAPRRREE